MRQIKFRAWDKAEKKMVRVNAIDFKNREFLEIECDESVSVVTIPKGEFPEHFILEQFAGLCDKNGKELYEGDKFKIVGYCVRGPVVFEKGCFGYRDLTDTFTPLAIKNGNYTGKMSDIEVIGNIHDEEASE